MWIHILVVQSLALPHVFQFHSLHSKSCSLFSKLHLTPKLSPSQCHRLHPCHRSSLCPGHDAEWLAGSCRRRGCRGWSTGPAEGDEPGGNTQPGPRPAEGWRGGNPPPAGPRTLRRSAGPSSKRSSHEASPMGAKTEYMMMSIQILSKVAFLWVWCVVGITI